MADMKPRHAVASALLSFLQVAGVKALGEGDPPAIAMAYAFQTITRYHRGDLTGAERYYKAELAFFDDQGKILAQEVSKSGGQSRESSEGGWYGS